MDVRAKFNYTAREAGELSFKKGDIIHGMSLTVSLYW